MSLSIHKRITEQLETTTGWMRLSVKGLKDIEDYEIIAEELMKIPGIVEISPYTNNKIIKVKYTQQASIQEEIIYTIGKLGYWLNSEGIYKHTKSSSVNRKGG